jgi:hypothetical protein
LNHHGGWVRRFQSFFFRFWWEHFSLCSQSIRIISKRLLYHLLCLCTHFIIHNSSGHQSFVFTELFHFPIFCKSTLNANNL